MSIEKQSNGPDASAQSLNGTQLTAANLAAHLQQTATISTKDAVRSWLNDSENPRRASVDRETWMLLVDRDPVAAAIEAGTRGGNQSREQQKKH